MSSSGFNFIHSDYIALYSYGFKYIEIKLVQHKICRFIQSNVSLNVSSNISSRNILVDRQPD